MANKNTKTKPQIKPEAVRPSAVGNLKSFFKENLSPILFFALIIFAGLSVWVTNSNSGKNAASLIEYADQSVPTVRSEIAKITNKTILLPNEPASFDEIVNDLNEFNKQLDNLAAGIPSQNTDQPSLRLQNNLRTFLQGVKSDVTQILDRTKGQKDLYQPRLDYGRMRVISTEGGTREDLQKAYDGGMKIQDFQRSLNQGVQDPASKSYQAERIEADQKILDQVKSVLEKTQDGALNLSDRDDLAKIYENSWPLDKPTFPRIQKDEIENQVFAQKIQQLQQDLTDLKQKYNLK
jgi:hypothetical protein